MREIRAGSALAQRGADVLRDALHERLRDRTRVSLALSGGRTPWTVFRRLAEASIDWERVDIYQVDERVAPAGSRARNLSGLTESLLQYVPATVHPMPVEDDDLDAAAAQYASELPERLDVVHLGLGDDGHTASLIPHDPILEVVDRRVATTRPYQGHRRMTLTFPTLNAANTIVWIVAGAGKAAMLQSLREADPSIPAGRISQENALLVTGEVEDPREKESP